MKSLRLLIQFLILVIPFIFISCTDSPDSVITKPSISITNPVMNSNVPDSTTINLAITDIDNIIRVELFIDHNLVNVYSKPPYTYFWNTNYYYYPDGSQHIIEAKAYDDKGNIYTPTPSIVYFYRFMPSGLIANLVSNSKIVLTWYDNCRYETGFEIEQGSGDSTFIKIASVDSNTTSYTVNGNFQKDQKYLFRVRAKTVSSFSGYSNIAFANIYLKAPDITTVVYASDTTATISWKDSSDFESSFAIQQVKNGYLTTIKTVPANTTSTQITGEYINGTTYGFVVTAVDSFITSPSITRYFPYSIDPPANLSITQVDVNKIQLAWTNSASLSTQIKIERKESGLVYQEIGTVNAGVTKFTDNNLDTSKTYYYRVKAFTRINTVYSDEIKAAYVPQIVDYKNIKAPSNIASFDISRDLSKIVVGGYTATNIAVYLLDGNNGNLIRTYYPQDSLHICDNIGISYDNSVIGGGGNANNVDLWNVNDGSLRGTLKLGYYCGGLVFHPYKNIAVTYTTSLYDIGIWNYENGALFRAPNAGEQIYKLTWSNSGNLLAVAGEKDVKIIDITSGNIIKTISTGLSISATFCDNDNSIISCNQGKLTIWNIDNLISTGEYNSQFGQLFDVTAIPGTNYVIISDGDLEIFDKFTGKIVSRFISSETNTHIKLLTDNKTIVSYEWNYLYFRRIEKRWAVPFE